MMKNKLIIWGMVVFVVGVGVYYVWNNQDESTKEIKQEFVNVESEQQEDEIGQDTMTEEKIVAIENKPINSFENYNVAKPEQLTKIKSADDEALTELRNQHIFSPNGKYKAITNSTEGGDITTYITTTQGQKITQEYCGSFTFWTPDSDKVFLYLTDHCKEMGKVYYLDLGGNYYDAGLPKGVLSANISPVDNNIVYTAGNMYIRNSKGDDRLLLQAGEKTTLAWSVWSPRGDKIAFRRMDYIVVDQGKNFWEYAIWVVNSDGTNLTKISNSDWSYHPAWSPDGSKIIFVNGSSIWEYKINN